MKANRVFACGVSNHIYYLTQLQHLLDDVPISLMSAFYNQADLDLLADDLTANLTLNCDLPVVNVVQQEVYQSCLL